MKHLNIIYLSLIIFYSIFPHTISAQSWEDLGNPIVNGEAVGDIHTIEGFGSTVYFCTDKGLFSSNDNGSTFTNLTWQNGVTQNQVIRCVYVDTDGSIFIGGDTSVYKSIDGGTTWSTTAITTAMQVNDIEKAGINYVISFGETNLNGGVFYSTDNLVTATQSTSIPQLQMIDLFFYNNVLFLAGKDAVYSSIDLGVNWAVAGTGHPSGGKYFSILEDGGALFAGDVFGNGLYKSTDEGQTWANTDPSTFNGFCQVFDITAANGFILAVVDGTCNMGEPIKFSNDNGVTWNSALFNLSSAFYNELGRNASGSCLFVYNSSLKILYRICDLTLGTNELYKTTFSIYPNPTDDKINIKSTESGIAKLYAMDGKYLKSIQIVNNLNSVDLSSYPSGIYFIHFQTQDASIIKRIVKE